MVFGGINTSGNPPGGGGAGSGVATAVIRMDAAQFAGDVHIVIGNSRTMAARIEKDAADALRGLAGLRSGYQDVGKAAGDAAKQMQVSGTVDTSKATRSVRDLAGAYKEVEQAAARAARSQEQSSNAANSGVKGGIADAVRRATEGAQSAQANIRLRDQLAAEARRNLARLDAEDAVRAASGFDDTPEYINNGIRQAALAGSRSADNFRDGFEREMLVRPPRIRLGEERMAGASAVASAVDLGPLNVDRTGLRDRGRLFQQEANQAREQADALAASLDTAGNSARYGLAQGLGDAAIAATALYAVFAAQGIGVANEVQRTELLFRQLSGSEEAAARNMAILREMSQRTKQPFLGLVDAANQILPALRGGNAELDETLSLMQRLAILDPAQGQQGAAIALREFLSGETTSLQRRFELERSTLNAIKTSTEGDPRARIRALTEYIEQRTGLTEQAMERLGDEGFFAFERLADAGRQLLDHVFRPLLNNGVLPLIDGIVHLADVIRGIDPGLLAALASGVGAAGIVRGIDRLQSIGLIGAGTSRRGQYAAATVGALSVGTEAGLIAARGVARVAGISGFGSQEEARATISNTLGQLVVLAGEGIRQFLNVLIKGGYIIENVFEQVGNLIKLGGLKIDEGITNLTVGLGDLIKDIGEQVGNADIAGRGAGIAEYGRGRLGESRRLLYTSGHLEEIPGSGILGQIQAIEDRLSQGLGFTPQQNENMRVFNEEFNQVFRSFLTGVGILDEVSEAVDNLNTAGSQFTVDQRSGWEEYNADLLALQEEAHQNQIEESTRFVNQQHQIIDAYEQNLQYMLEDLGVAAGKAAEVAGTRTIAGVLQVATAQIQENYANELTAGIAEINSKAHDDEVKDQRNHDDKLLELRESAADDLEELEEDRIKKLRDLWEDFRDAMDTAVAARDVVAAIEARKAYAKGERDANEDYQDAVSERREALEKEIADQRKAFETMQADRAESTAREIEQLRSNIAAREAEDIKNLKTQLERDQKAHEDQMTELNTQHIDRLDAIQDNLDNESQKLTDGFLELFENVNTNNTLLGNIMAKGWQWATQRASDAAMAEFLRQHGIYQGTAAAMMGDFIVFANNARLAFNKALGQGTPSGKNAGNGSSVVGFTPGAYVPVSNRGDISTSGGFGGLPVGDGGVRVGGRVLTPLQLGLNRVGMGGLAALLHPEEMVVNPNDARYVRSMLGHNAGGREIASALANSSGGSNMTVVSMNLNFNRDTSEPGYIQNEVSMAVKRLYGAAQVKLQGNRS